MRSIDVLNTWLEKRGFTSRKVSLGYPENNEYFLIAKPGNKKELLFTVKGLSYPAITRATRDVTADKTKTYDLAHLMGINFPKSLTIKASEASAHSEDLTEFLQELGTVVVKPTNGLQSRGVTLDVKDTHTLQSAIKHAGTIGEDILVQQQIAGEEVRLVVIDRKVRSVLLRQKPYVVGNGTSTIEELLAVENHARAKISQSLATYPKLEGELVQLNRPLSDIPEKDEWVEISKATMIRNGASVYDVLSSIDQSYIDIAEKICQPLLSPMLCVDLMIEDFTKPASAKNYSLIEINTGMSLLLCYSCRDGKNFDIIEQYLGPMLLKEFEALQ